MVINKFFKIYLILFAAAIVVPSQIYAKEVTIQVQNCVPENMPITTATFSSAPIVKSKDSSGYKCPYPVFPPSLLLMNGKSATLKGKFPSNVTPKFCFNYGNNGPPFELPYKAFPLSDGAKVVLDYQVRKVKGQTSVSFCVCKRGCQQNCQGCLSF